MSDPARLDVADIEALCDEATRQGLSLACLIGALVDGSPILWMAEEKRDEVADQV